MSWLDKVHKAEDESPPWLLSVIGHGCFLQLDRIDGHRIVTTEEVEFRAETLRDVCQQFAAHYGLK